MSNLLIILMLLIAPYFLLGAVPALRNWPQFRGSIGLTAVFCFTGVGHFLIPEPMSRMIPPFIPFRLEIIYVSGVIEILAGLALLPLSTRRGVGWLILVMLILLTQANIYAAIERVPVGGHEWGTVYLWVRLPLQLVLIGWCCFFAIRPCGPNPTSST